MKKILYYLFLISSAIFCGCSFFAKQSAANYYIVEGIKEEKGNNWSAALQDYTKALNLDPHIAGGYALRGHAKAKLHDSMGARVDFYTAIHNSPEDANTYNLMGLSELEENMPDSALIHFNKALSLKKDFAYAFNNKSYVEYEKYDSLDAFADNSKSILLDPSNSWAYVYRGLMKLEFHHDSIGALEDFNIAITKPNLYERAYFEKGRLSIYMGQKDLGCSYLHKAKDLGYTEADKAIQQYCNHQQN